MKLLRLNSSSSSRVDFKNPPPNKITGVPNAFGGSYSLLPSFASLDLPAVLRVAMRLRAKEEKTIQVAFTGQSFQYRHQIEMSAACLAKLIAE